jgi:hypothetical protein
MKPLFALAACAIALSIPSLASASILYSSLPDSDISSPNIYGDYSISAQFSLTDDSVLDSATVGLWMALNTPPSSLDWSIQSASNGGVLFSGIGAALTNDGPSPVRNGQYDLYYSTFTLPSIALDAGTYWLHLSNCGTTDADGCGWGINSASGSDVQFSSNGSSAIGKVAFSVQGAVATTAPEPATWLMFVPALAGLATVIRRRA